MNVNQYINTEVKPLSVNSLVSEVQELFKRLTFSHLPVTENDLLVGVLCEREIQALQTQNPIGQYNYALDSFFVKTDMWWIEVLEVFAQNDTNIMPVLNAQQKYVGYYELSEIVGLFNETPFFNQVGNILVVEKGIRDYSFSEASQIIESNNGHLLGAFVSKIEGDLIQLTLKIGGGNINDIIQTYRRYGYQIVLETKADLYLEDLREHSDYLNKYLNI